MTQEPQVLHETIEFDIHRSIAHRLDAIFKSTNVQKRKEQEEEFNALLVKHTGKTLSFDSNEVVCVNANLAENFFQDVYNFARRHQDVKVAFQCAIPAEDFFNRALYSLRYPE